MRTKQEQDTIRAHLDALATKNGGLLTPETVVNDARKKNSPLHGHFEWDATKAAHQHWLEQARELIRSVRVVMRTEKTTISVVAYVRDPSLAAGEQGYRSTVSICNERDSARDVLVEEFTRAAGALRRARELAVAFDMVEEVSAVVQDVDDLKTKVVASVEVRT